MDRSVIGHGGDDSELCQPLLAAGIHQQAGRAVPRDRDLGGQLQQRQQHEGALVQARVRQGQPGFFDDALAVQQQVQVERARSIAMGALFTAHHLGCRAIIALTESGSTALWMSRHNIHVPIFGLTAQAGSERRMALYRNVRPILMKQHTDRDQALADAERVLVERGVLKPGDTYAITCGEPMGYPGGTNMLKVCRVA